MLQAPELAVQAILEAGTEVEERNFEGFWERWGQVSGFEKHKLNLYWDEVATYYDPELHYHNFQHGVTVAWRTMEIIDEYEPKGVIFNRKAVIGAALVHDAAYHKDHQALGYTSKKALAAAIYASLGYKYNFECAEIQIGNQAIAATKAYTKPMSNEAVAMVRADLGPVGQDYSLSKQDTDLLRAEDKLLKQRQSKRFNELEFMGKSIWALLGYAIQDLSLEPDDQSPWLTQIKTTIRLMYTELMALPDVSAPPILQNLGSAALKVLDL